MSNSVIFLGLLVSTLAMGHSLGIHKVSRLTVSKTSVEVLLTMEFETGKRTSLLRAAADANHDGVLSNDEGNKLKNRLLQMALRPFVVKVNGRRLAWRSPEVKLDLRQEFRTTSEGLSLAVFLTSEAPLVWADLNRVEVVDASPDGSHVRVEGVQVDEKGNALMVFPPKEMDKRSQTVVFQLTTFVK